MKYRLFLTVCGLLPATLLGGCFQMGRILGVGAPFTDIGSSRASPDGGVLAAYVIDAPGPLAGNTYAITLTAAGGNPLRGTVIIATGTDDRDLVYRWVSRNMLQVRLPCGWWVNAANHWQLSGTDRVVSIDFIKAEGCPGRKWL
ncbi:hypothetical protein [Sphingomonas bacterium]|uniref:hypothetical protein n=1 Tax=Sphingomonas bacterium TaxID=1895847 RepID=UPI0015773335|nr:hypothetical protein [Sphingomonas bacterium]